MKPTYVLLILVVLLFVSTACGAAGAPAPQAELNFTSEEAPAVAEEFAGEGAALDEDALNAPQAQQIERVIIRTADLSLRVADVTAAERALNTLATEFDGYIVASQRSGTEEYLRVSISMRIPSERFDDALTRIEGLADRVLSRSVSGDDVTEEFVDLQARLGNLEATRDRLLDLLNEARRVEDALSVNQALTDVQGQIEQIEGRLQYLQQSAALSTIHVALEPVPTTPIVAVDGWQPLEVARGALRGLLEFGQGLINIAIVLGIWTPVWLPIVLLIGWVFRRIRRAVNRPVKQAALAAPPAPSETAS
ncbi:MAG: DUF4349 domain-containing protein [Chloroflexaceae bacterium]|nr:DUF4349 domain-containing protein [Chloroflexaceae bacterium]NJO04226.1 DUF4349 domain-containing protein [Chloroflexaceae bacterium]